MIKNARLFTTSRWCILIISSLLIVIGPVTLIAFKYFFWAAVFYYLPGISLFYILLEMKAERVIKGVALIFFGLFYKFSYTFIFQESLPDTSPLGNYLSILGDGILFACSGAGGSIIAVHGDKSSTDADPAPALITGPDASVHLQRLINKTDSMGARLNVLIWAVGALVLALVVILLSYI